MLDDAAIFLRGAGHEARYIDQRQDRDVEGIAEAHEARALGRGIDVQAAGQHHRLVGDHADCRAFHADEADDDVLRILRLQFEEVAFVGQLDDQFLDVIGLGRVFRHQAVERDLFAGRRIFAGPDRWLFAVVGRQEVEETPRVQQRLHIVFQRQIGNAGT